MSRPQQPPQPPRPGDPDDDPVLREMFAALRREDQRAVPGFDRLLDAALRGGRRLSAPAWFWMEAAAFTVALLALLVFFLPWRAHRPASAEDALALARAIGAWEAPTDGLLEVSLLKMPDTVPTLEYTSVPLPADTTSSRSTQ
jgi:hypothetical protein